MLSTCFRTVEERFGSCLSPMCFMNTSYFPFMTLNESDMFLILLNSLGKFYLHLDKET